MEKEQQEVPLYSILGSMRRHNLVCSFTHLICFLFCSFFTPVGFAQSGDVAYARVSGEQPIPGAVGLSGSYGKIEDDRNGFLGTTRWHQETLSGNTRLRGYSLELSLSHNWAKKDLDEHTLTSGPDAGSLVAGGTTTSRSTSVLGSVGHQLGSWYVSGFFAYTQGEIDEFREINGLTASWDRDFESNTLGLSLSTLMDIGGGWYLAPSMQYIRLQTVSDPTVDSLGKTVSEERDLLIRGNFGGEIGYQSMFGGLIATTGLRPYFVYDFQQFQDFSDKTAFDFTGFLTLAGEQITGGLEISTTVGREETDSVSGRLFIGIKF